LEDALKTLRGKIPSTRRVEIFRHEFGHLTSIGRVNTLNEYFNSVSAAYAGPKSNTKLVKQFGEAVKIFEAEKGTLGFIDTTYVLGQGNPVRRAEEVFAESSRIYFSRPDILKEYAPDIFKVLDKGYSTYVEAANTLKLSGFGGRPFNSKTIDAYAKERGKFLERVGTSKKKTGLGQGLLSERMAGEFKGPDLAAFEEQALKNVQTMTPFGRAPRTPKIPEPKFENPEALYKRTIGVISKRTGVREQNLELGLESYSGRGGGSIRYPGRSKGYLAGLFEEKTTIPTTRRPGGKLKGGRAKPGTKTPFSFEAETPVSAVDAGETKELLKIKKGAKTVSSEVREGQLAAVRSGGEASYYDFVNRPAFSRQLLRESGAFSVAIPKGALAAYTTSSILAKGKLGEQVSFQPLRAQVFTPAKMFSLKGAQEAKTPFKTPFEIPQELKIPVETPKEVPALTPLEIQIPQEFPLTRQLPEFEELPDFTFADFAPALNAMPSFKPVAGFPRGFFVGPRADLAFPRDGGMGRKTKDSLILRSNPLDKVVFGEKDVVLSGVDKKTRARARAFYARGKAFLPASFVRLPTAEVFPKRKQKNKKQNGGDRK